MKLKELEDYEGFPQTLRLYQMDFIGTIVSFLHLYKPIVPKIDALLQHIQSKQIIDLCSGSGQPAIDVHQKLENIDKSFLTDKFPQQIKEISGVIYKNTPVDVLTTTFEPQYCYTMYNAFHHFTSEEQKSIVDKLQQANALFIFVEVLRPTLLSMIEIILVCTIGQLLFTPFIKPFSLKRLLFTYIIPINIFTVLYDGIISVIKSKSTNAYKALLAGNNSDLNKQSDYILEIKTIFKFPTTLTFIQGIPTT